MDQFIAQIQIWGCNFAPRDWAFCDGQLLPIANNTALFSLIGDIYGGDGRSTVGLPNLKGRAPMNFGHGLGLSNYNIGQLGGDDTATITNATMATHNHAALGEDTDGTEASPQNNFLAKPVIASRSGTNPVNIYADANNLETMAPEAVTITGDGEPHDNMQPYLAVNFCIALAGTFPPRN